MLRLTQLCCCKKEAKDIVHEEELCVHMYLEDDSKNKINENT